MSLLTVNNLQVRFKTPEGIVNAVNKVNFSVEKGKTLGIVGESGSGKSQTVLALMGLLANNGEVLGSIQFKGEELIGLPVARLNKIRGHHMAMIFQDPMTSLNPYLTVAKQMIEVLVLHKGMTKAQAQQEALNMLDAVKIPEASKRLNMYPHEFSGGMRQRVMIAMALLCRPELLIADEPTTALDVTVQAQILALLRELQQDFNTSIIMITHDLGVVAGSCDDVMVMYAGQTMEHAGVDAIFAKPLHPYTQGLLNALPRLDQIDEELVTIPGNPPNLLHLPAGCPFQQRCPVVSPVCAEKPPLLRQFNQRTGACHRIEEVA
ncbi:Stage 0 sporulation protein KD [Piscirickettsia salmonis]|uniref:oligopeptide/dipeptide ABC transporter ATP-binding protein n=1 Tax=Piscirickettsia salmonis TaxID=1238 RepID=UPI0012B8CC9B|nr:oligopeptide/dipeptide ABC transporter ATP-binding protein [Piscirickettsia salmonis]QGP49329.1 Stage 0 sporulation protein KD [Piscirickettsia salmonis]QGP55846.1 Stage 0 sporulation protein KD [Piscirickettsia salmonis]QGP65415.1 Stage 0 sporulation protein KD [Piscirickettsia salmonis]